MANINKNETKDTNKVMAILSWIFLRVGMGLMVVSSLTPFLLSISDKNDTTRIVTAALFTFFAGIIIYLMAFDISKMSLLKGFKESLKIIWVPILTGLYAIYFTKNALYFVTGFAVFLAVVSVIYSIKNRKNN